MTLKIAHLSDLHFSIPSYNPLQFFSKRWLGNLNFILFRRQQFVYERLPKLLPLFKEKGISHVLITGDLTTTSLKQEFLLAQRFIDTLKSGGLQVVTLPGNHDHYTKRAFKKKSFYDFFGSTFDEGASYNLKEHGLTLKSLGNHWHLIALDQTVYPTLISSQGYFSEALEKNLKELLFSLGTKQNIILAGHFPFFQSEGARKKLIHGDRLKEILIQHPHIRFYLHGHTHRLCVADLRASQMPIILDPGSTPHRNSGGCHLLEINSEECNLEVYNWKEEWTRFQEHHFKW